MYCPHPVQHWGCKPRYIATAFCTATRVNAVQQRGANPAISRPCSVQQRGRVLYRIASQYMRVLHGWSKTSLISI